MCGKGGQEGGEKPSEGRGGGKVNMCGKGKGVTMCGEVMGNHVWEREGWG